MIPDFIKHLETFQIYIDFINNLVEVIKQHENYHILQKHGIDINFLNLKYNTLKLTQLINQYMHLSSLYSLLNNSKNLELWFQNYNFEIENGILKCNDLDHNNFVFKELYKVESKKYSNLVVELLSLIDHVNIYINFFNTKINNSSWDVLLNLSDTTPHYKYKIIGNNNNNIKVIHTQLKNFILLPKTITEHRYCNLLIQMEYLKVDIKSLKSIVNQFNIDMASQLKTELPKYFLMEICHIVTDNDNNQKRNGENLNCITENLLFYLTNLKNPFSVDLVELMANSLNANKIKLDPILKEIQPILNEIYTHEDRLIKLLDQAEKQPLMSNLEKIKLNQQIYIVNSQLEQWQNTLKTHPLKKNYFQLMDERLTLTTIINEIVLDSLDKTPAEVIVETPVEVIVETPAEVIVETPVEVIVETLSRGEGVYLTKETSIVLNSHIIQNKTEIIQNPVLQEKSVFTKLKGCFSNIFNYTKGFVNDWYNLFYTMRTNDLNDYFEQHLIEKQKSYQKGDFKFFTNEDLKKFDKSWMKGSIIGCSIIVGVLLLK